MEELPIAGIEYLPVFPNVPTEYLDFTIEVFLFVHANHSFGHNTSTVAAYSPHWAVRCVARIKKRTQPVSKFQIELRGWELL